MGHRLGHNRYRDRSRKKDTDVEKKKKRAAKIRELKRSRAIEALFSEKSMADTEREVTGEPARAREEERVRGGGEGGKV